MPLKTHYSETPGMTPLIAPATHPLKLLNFAMLQLEPGESYQAQSEGDEVGLVFLHGTGTVAVNQQTISDLGGRASVWEGRATGVYVPRDATFTVTAQTPIEVAICRTAAASDHPVQVVRPDQIVVREVGNPGYQRIIHDILGLTNCQAHQLLIGETFSRTGNWSSFPPHKHDTYAAGVEAQQEELYFFKIRPAQGFGVQLIYTRPGTRFEPLDEALMVHQDDVTIMPYGYHPVSAPPGYDVYYLWFMAGLPRIMLPNEDPDHTWVKMAPPEERAFPH